MNTTTNTADTAAAANTAGDAGGGVRNPAVRVFLVDDHQIIRQGLRRLLEHSPAIAVAGEAASAEELLRAQPDADVVVLDLSMPGIGGFEAIKMLHASRPRLGIVVLTMRAEDEYAVRCLRAGALGFVSKDASIEEITAAIHAAANGRRYMSDVVADALMAALVHPNGDAPHKSLSDRELEVLHLLGAGYGVTEISALLYLSVKTVSTYKTRIHQKLQISSIAGLIRYAVDNDLVGARDPRS